MARQRTEPHGRPVDLPAQRQTRAADSPPWCRTTEPSAGMEMALRRPVCARFPCGPRRCAPQRSHRLLVCCTSPSWSCHATLALAATKLQCGNQVLTTPTYEIFKGSCLDFYDLSIKPASQIRHLGGILAVVPPWSLHGYSIRP